MFKPIGHGKLDKSQTVHIVGAGFSGLIMGYFLKQHGFTIKIYEKNKVGGKIQTLHHSQGLQECAANAIYADEEILNWLRSLQLKPQITPKLKKYIFDSEGFHQAPSFGFILKVIKNLITKKPTEITPTTTLDTFFSPLLSFAQKWREHLFQGVYGLKSSKLSLLAIYPQLANKKCRSYFAFMKELKNSPVPRNKKQSISFEKGMGELIEKLRRELQNEFVFENVQDITKYEQVIICTMATEAALLFHDQNVVKELSRITYTPMTNFTVFFDRHQQRSLFNKSFGFLIAHEKFQDVLGLMFNHELFPERFESKTGSITIIMSGRKNETDAKAFLAAALPEITPQLIYPHIWDHGLPQYNQELYEARLKLAELLPANTWLFGNYTSGISLREMYYIAKTFASQEA